MVGIIQRRMVWLDVNFMKQKIEIQLPCPAFVTTMGFEDQKVMKAFEYTVEGIITEFDEESKYVNWERNGVKQSPVNINCVSFILNKKM
jgi:hypothetical protein